MSPAALTAARLRHQQAHESIREQRITIGTSTYPAAVVLGPVRREPLDDGSGSRLVQRATIRLRKALLPAAPTQGTVISFTPAGTTTALQFTLIEAGDQTTGEVAHVLQVMRLPPRS